MNVEKTRSFFWRIVPSDLKPESWEEIESSFALTGRTLRGVEFGFKF